MIKCTILIPTQDNEGKNLDQEYNEILDCLYETFGGWTVEGFVNGAYRLENGAKAYDTSYRVTIIVENARVGELERELPAFARQLRQETLYYEKSPSAVEFVPAVKHGTFSEGTAVDGVTIGEFSDVFDGRNKEHNRLARIEEENRQEQVNQRLVKIEKAYQQGNVRSVSGKEAGHILKAVNRDGGELEVADELSVNTVWFLKQWGLSVRVYRHKGSVATVIRSR